MTPQLSAATARILFVDHAAVLGGAELSLLDIATEYRDHGAVALFEDGPFARALADNGVAVFTVASGAALRRVKKATSVPGPAAIASVLRAALSVAHRARAFDVLYANSPKSFLVCAVAGWLARKPVIWHLRDILDNGHFSHANVWTLIHAGNHRASRVIANSHATAAAFVAAGGRRDLVRVVHNGIDASPFDRLAPDERDVVRRELGIGDGAFVVGCFSRLHPWKGQRVLLDALSELPNVHALIVGGALFSGEGEYAAELRARVSSPPLGGRVQLLGARHDVPRLIAACDAIVHPSVLPEPFGRVLVEALLARRPLVVSDAGGVREIVEPGVTAQLVPPGDAPLLARAIAAVRDDPGKAAVMAAAGSADVRRRFTKRAMLDGVAAGIDDVLQRTRL